MPILLHINTYSSCYITFSLTFVIQTNVTLEFKNTENFGENLEIYLKNTGVTKSPWKIKKKITEKGQGRINKLIINKDNINSYVFSVVLG